MPKRAAHDAPPAVEKKAIRILAVRQHRDAIDDYGETVRGLYAFALSACWDESARSQRPSAKWCVPRKMDRPAEAGDPSSVPPVLPRAEVEVTPDAVIQITGSYGVIAEMKKNFSAPRSGDIFKQVAKYDADLIGWWTPSERIELHDLVLLTHLASGVKAKDAYAEWRAEGNEFDRAFAIVEFSYQSQGQLWYHLRKVGGALSDSQHDETLRVGKLIRDQLLVDLFSKWKFSEQEPPLMHMLLLIHDYIIPLLRPEMEFEKETGGKFPSVNVSVEELRDKLAEQFGPPVKDARFFSLPRLAWVRTAVDQLVRIGLATPLPRSTANAASDAAVPRAGEGRSDGETQQPDDQLSHGIKYHITLRKPRIKDSIEFFSDKLLEAEWNASAGSQSQPSLFTDRESPSAGAIVPTVAPRPRNK